MSEHAATNWYVRGRRPERCLQGTMSALCRVPRGRRNWLLPLLHESISRTHSGHPSRQQSWEKRMSWGRISQTLLITGRIVYPPRDEVISSLQVPTADPDTYHHKRSMIKSTGNLAICVWLRGWYHLAGGRVGCPGVEVKRRVEIWKTGEQRTSMSRSLAVESKQLLSVIRMVAANFTVNKLLLSPE